jgi:small subunit ribosomal protein S8
MSTHDPISDLITRIRNAQMRSKSKVSSPGSKMRQNVLEVLKSEGYIRGYATVEHSSGRNELEIELNISTASRSSARSSGSPSRAAASTPR